MTGVDSPFEQPVMVELDDGAPPWFVEVLVVIAFALIITSVVLWWMS